MQALFNPILPRISTTTLFPTLKALKAPPIGEAQPVLRMPLKFKNGSWVQRLAGRFTYLIWDLQSLALFKKIRTKGVLNKLSFYCRFTSILL